MTPPKHSWFRFGLRALFLKRLPKLFRDRPLCELAWREIYPAEDFRVADAVLKLLCDAFRFDTRQRFRFRPEDSLAEIHRHTYRWRIADEMDIETLAIDLHSDFGIRLWDMEKDPTLRTIIDEVVRTKESS